MAQVEGHGARITDEGIARIRARIGKGFEGRRPWRTEVTKDAAYHMALGIGDTSPLYQDEAYAKKTKWGGLLAPYIMIQTFDTLRSVGHSGLPEGLPGVHSIWTGSLFAPVLLHFLNNAMVIGTGRKWFTFGPPEPPLIDGVPNELVRIAAFGLAAAALLWFALRVRDRRAERDRAIVRAARDG